MLKNEYPYTVRIEETDGIERYYISFTDGSRQWQETEVAPEVFAELEKSRKHEKRQLNFFDRHIEHSEVTEESLRDRASVPLNSLEETAIMRERENVLKSAVEELPEIQRRRFLMYYMDGLTYEQIAQRENCSHVAVVHSVDKARKAVTKKLKDY